MCSSRCGLGMLEHLISWTLPGSFIGEQTVLYLPVVLIMSMLIHLTGRKRKNWLIKSVEHSDRERCGTSGMGGDFRGVIETEKECVLKEKVLLRELKSLD